MDNDTMLGYISRATPSFSHLMTFHLPAITNQTSRKAWKNQIKLFWTICWTWNTNHILIYWVVSVHFNKTLFLGSEGSQGENNEPWPFLWSSQSESVCQSTETLSALQGNAFTHGTKWVSTYLMWKRVQPVNESSYYALKPQKIMQGYSTRAVLSNLPHPF